MGRALAVLLLCVGWTLGTQCQAQWKPPDIRILTPLEAAEVTRMPLTLEMLMICAFAFG